MVATLSVSGIMAIFCVPGVKAGIHFFDHRDGGNRYLQGREITVTVTQNNCPLDTVVPSVETSLALSSTEYPPYTPYVPYVPVITSGSTVETTPVVVTTSVESLTVPMTTATVSQPGFETSQSTQISTETKPETVSSTESTMSTTATPATSTILEPSMTTSATASGVAAITSVNLGVLGLVALAALQQVY